MWENDGFEADTECMSPGDPAKRQRSANMTTAFDQRLRGFENAAGGEVVLQQQQQQQQKQQEEANSRREKWKQCCQRFVSIMLSHLGTLVLVVLYLILGGFLFNYLELENEKSACHTTYAKYESKRNEAVDRVYNIAQGGNTSTSKSAILNELEIFSKDVYTLGVDPTKNCSTIGVGDNQPNWLVANSIYFCTTIVTTIGYGHISPATMWGQIVCMIYSILGIPLMLLFLTKIGEPTAMLFRSFYLNICCCKCFVRSKRNPEEEERPADAQQTEWKTVEEGEAKQPPPKVGDVVVVDDDEDESGEDEIVNIPITVTLLLLILYIVIGAAVFSIWEKDWTIVEGTYFSFVTLSTIGFGDYVPGKDGPFDDPKIIIELLVGAVYCLFGLAMLSMCINLIQDEITAKLQWIGTKLGIVRPKSLDNEDGDSSDEEASTDDEEQEDAKTIRSSRTATAAKVDSSTA